MKLSARLLLTVFFSTLHFLTNAQKKNVKDYAKKKSNVSKSIKRLEIQRPDSIPAFELSYDGDTINRTDNFNLKQGLWIEKIMAHHGEPASINIGSYIDNWKYGKWKVIEGGEIIRIENYYRNTLNGEIQYFENGFLACKGYYVGSNNKNLFDTIELYNQQVGEIKKYIIATENVSFKDSLWTFYNIKTDKVSKLEYWHEDSLVYVKDFENEAPDSASLARYEALMPHKNKNIPIPFEKESRGMEVVPTKIKQEKVRNIAPAGRRR